MSIVIDRRTDQFIDHPCPDYSLEYKPSDGYGLPEKPLHKHEMPDDGKDAGQNGT